MRWSYSILAVGIFGIFSMFILFLFQEMTVKNDQDYYSIKEITEAAMIESVDIAYFRDTGEIKMMKEKFIENFTRRFAENNDLDDYTIDFYDVMEEPPKVTVKVSNSTNSYNIYGDPTSFNVVNKISGILNSEPNEDAINGKCYREEVLHSVPYAVTADGNYFQTINFNPEVGESVYKVVYLGSWRSIIGNDLSVASSLLKEYNIILNNGTYKYNSNGYEAILKNGYYLGSFANIEMKEFSLNNNELYYNEDYNCEVMAVANIKGVNTEICILGIRYKVIYKDNNCQ